jgi:hypothetical protein
MAVVAGVPQYKIQNYMNDGGPLPDPCVFVMEVVDPLDATKDTLTRVAQVADYFAYPSLRTSAVYNTVGFYRSPGVTTSYADLSLATDAAQAYRDRVNQLVSDWMTYEYKFKHTAPGAAYDMPTADLSGIAQLVGAWQTAQVAAATANGALDTASADVTTAQTAYDAAADKLTTMQSVSELIVDLGAQSDALGAFLARARIAKIAMGVAPFPYPDGSSTAGSGLWQATANLVNAIVALPSSSIDSTALGLMNAAKTVEGQFISSGGLPALNIIWDQLFGASGIDAYAPFYAAETSRIGDFNAKVTAASTAKAAAQAALDTATKTKNTAQSNYDSATLATGAALAAVYAACPVFDPNNPTGILA